MEQAKLDEYVRAFHLMWDNYPEPVRLIDRTFTIVAGNKLYMTAAGSSAPSAIRPATPPCTGAARPWNRCAPARRGS